MPSFPDQTDESRTYPISTVPKWLTLNDTTTGWVFPADSNSPDYHDNMDGVMFLKWVENSLIPCFKARYPGKKMILMLDGASYHLIRDRNDGTHFLPRKNSKQVCITKLNELSIADSNSAGLHFEFTRPADKNDLSKGVKKYIACDEAWRESNSVMDNSDVSIVDFSKTGTPNVNEIQEFTHKYIKQNHPSLLENDLDRLLREKCDGSYSLVTPPYSPKF